MVTLNDVAEQYFLSVKNILCDTSIGHEEAARIINSNLSSYSGNDFRTTESSVRRWRKSRYGADIATEAAEAARDALKPFAGSQIVLSDDNPSMTFSEPQEQRTLYIDIEMTPNLVHTWQLKQVDIWHENIIKPSEMICFSAKWAGEKTQFYSVYHDGKDTMLSMIWNLLNDADLVVHFYGKRFDVPKINTELLLAGYPPPSPFRQLDLCLAMRRKFAFPSNKLDYIAKVLGTSGKKKGIGYENWVKCMAGDPEAWQIMREYSIQDTDVLPEIHEKVKPWISAPSVISGSGKIACPACGNVTLEKRGFAYTSVSAYQRYHCTSCGKWSRDTKRISGSSVTAISD